MGKWVYEFGDGAAEGRAEMRELLGGKGANLAEMTSLGVPVQVWMAPPRLPAVLPLKVTLYSSG